MDTDREIWRVWASSLQRWGIVDWVVSLLEAVGPLTILGAQAIYVGQPLLSYALPNTHLNAMAGLLEDSTQVRDFVAFLREVNAGEL